MSHKLDTWARTCDSNKNKTIATATTTRPRTRTITECERRRERETQRQRPRQRQKPTRDSGSDQDSIDTKTAAETEPGTGLEKQAWHAPPYYCLQPAALVQAAHPDFWRVQARQGSQPPPHWATVSSLRPQRTPFPAHARPQPQHPHLRHPVQQLN